MRVLVSVDMEGVAGVVHPEDISPGHPEYERNRRYMTDEASAVVRGVLAADPDTAVLVADAHADFRNLLPDALPRGCRLVRGGPRAHGMLAGLDDDTDAVLLVGYHAMAGAGGAGLAHTVSGATISQVRCDGVAVGEIGLAAMLAGHHGAATVFCSGDDMACAEARAAVPSIVAVPVKRALGNRAADSLHPVDACERLQAAAESALRSPLPESPERSTAAVELEIDLLRPVMADHAARIPGARRIGGRTVGFRAADTPAAYELVDLVAEVAAST